MQLSFKVSVKNFVALVRDATRNIAREFATKFREWWGFYKTRITFIFKKFIRKVLVYYSVLITYLEVVFLIFFRDWLLTMNVVLFVTLVILVPLLYIAITFVCSLHPKSRDELDKYVGYGKHSIREKLDDIETTSKDIKDKLNSHIKEGHHE